MLSIRGNYQNGKITLKTSGMEIPDASQVLLTFLTKETSNGVKSNDQSFKADEHDDDYYQAVRAHERVKAHGKITIIRFLDQMTFPLFDYSQGGLSFISNQPFEIGGDIGAAISDPSDPELVLMELDMEVRGIFLTDRDQEYKVGCMFKNPMDEELWHGVLQFLS